MRQCAVDWLEGTWSFMEGAAAAAASGAIADVRDGPRVSSLVPSSSGEEVFAVFRVVLPKGLDDSGFVGWLASTIKAATGSGLFVICGYDRQRGGIYDYYGVPVGAASSVKVVLDSLVREPTSLAGVVMRSVTADDGPMFGPGVVFCFDVRGDSITARYGGGSIHQGLLTASMSADESSTVFHFAHTGVDGPRSGRFGGLLRRDDADRWSVALLPHYDGGSGAAPRLLLTQA
jgi:hypothetical protein